MRLETATALAGVTGDTVHSALLAATKDQNARVRARALTSLAASKDPSLANVYQQFLNDQSYGVIRAAAAALGQTKTPEAYEALVKLMDVPSWRDTIRASALNGLASLADKRGLDLGMRYVGKGNRTQVRAAAMRLLGVVGKDDPRVFPLISESVGQAFDKGDFAMATASAEALVTLGDPRGIEVFDQLLKNAADIPQLKTVVMQFQERLRRAMQTPANTTARPQQ